MRILLWKVHGSYTESLVQGQHDYLFLDSAVPENGLRLGGREQVVSSAELRANPPDVLLIQRLEEIDWCRDLGLDPGRRVPAVFCEHNTPRAVLDARHPLADQDRWLVVHVTHFNGVMWDCGSTRTTVVEHGIVDPGPLYTGTENRAAYVVNEPVRRTRVAGADLLPLFLPDLGVDCFGIHAELLPSSLGVPAERLRFCGNLPPRELHAAMARRRLYLHLNRWTSLGLSLLEAMHLAMPVVVLAATEAYRAVPPEAGFLSTDPAELLEAARRLTADPDLARQYGQQARSFALDHYGLERFLQRWDEVLHETARLSPARVVR